MSPEQQARIAELGRRRGAELADLARTKSGVLRVLGWPEAVRRAQQPANEAHAS